MTLERENVELDEGMETGARKRRARKVEGSESVEKDPGPVGPHTVQLPKEVWKDCQRLGLDLDMKASALILEWILPRLARYGKRYKIAGQTGGEKRTVETLPMSQNVTSCGEESDSPLIRAGEGGDEGQPIRARRRA